VAYFWTRKRVPNGHERRSSCCSSWLRCYQIFQLLRLFHFTTLARRLMTTLSTRDNVPDFQLNHRLNGSSSPVLTATCLSYGSLCDFLTFFKKHAWGSDAQPIFTQNGSNDVDSHIDVPFAVKIETFCNPRPPNPPKFAQFWSGLRSISRLTLGSQEQTPLILHRSPIKVS